METPVFIIVLIAALLHAVWNTFIKANGDRLTVMAMMTLGSGLGAAIAIPFLPLPAPESWGYIALSVVLHQGYMAFLLAAYRTGDLSHVYPLARGSAPLAVAFVSFALIGEQLTGSALTAVVMIGAGIISLSFTRGTQGLRNPQAVLWALGTGLFIAGYTVTDGVGARLSGNAQSYSAWLFATEWIPIVLYVVATRRRELPVVVPKIWKGALAMGLVSLVAYGMAIWAMTVAPIALVAALRETSIVFAVLFGVLFLREPLNLARLGSTLITLAGVVVLKTGRT